MATTKELSEAHKYEIHVAAGRITAAREDRDNAIRQAYLDGVSVADIAKEAELSRQRVYKILEGGRS
jgi:Mor family transcriptional regulator